MDAYIFRFRVDDLRKIESGTLGFLIASGHCCNELVAMMPYIVFEQSLDGANEVEAAFISTRRYTIDRVIISKIVEYDDLCHRFFRQQTRQEDDFYASLKRECERMRASIKVGKWARIARNKTSFHYDEKYASESLNNMDGAHPLRIILGRISGITLFEFSEEVLSRPVFETAGSGDIGEGMDVANRFIVKAIGAIRDFHSNSMIAAFKWYGLITERESAELREKYCGNPGVYRVPISISEDYIAKNPSAGRAD